MEKTLEEPLPDNIKSAIAAIANTLFAELTSRMQDALWTSADIADYLRLSKKTVQNHIIDKPGFPAPIILATGGKRWIAKEVKAWALRR